MNNNNKAILLAAISLFASSSSFASICLYPHTEPWVLSDGSRAIAQTQARNTWEDWIWRGPIFKCPIQGNTGCPYRWDNTKTTGYSYSVGGWTNPDKLPVVGRPALGVVSPTGGYSPTKSFTTTYSWMVNVSPGWYAQPIQVVHRRWASGVYKGANHNTGKVCAKGFGSMPKKSWYSWDSNVIMGHWSTNIDVGRYATYHMYH